MYPCEVEGCNRMVQIRSTIRTGENKGKKACSVCAAKSKPKKQYQRKIKPISDKTLVKRKQRSAIRDEYFEYHIQRITHSEESGRRIIEPSRMNCCHLLPKSSHPSLQANLKNVVYLTGDEHTLFDSRFSKAQFEKLEKDFPRSWPIVCERLTEIMPLCKERTNIFVKLEKYLNERKNREHLS